MSEERLPRSAMDEVRNILALAKKEGQQVQVLKALVFLSEQMPQIDEDKDEEAIGLIRKELATARTPEKQLLHSLLASRYQQIYDERKWDLMDQTPVMAFNDKDLATWSLKDFHSAISTHYLASLEEANELKKISTRDYEPIILKGNASQLRPTLFDLLAHQALKYFRNDERDLPDPVNVFTINDPVVFADAATFSRADVVTSDSSSLYYRAIRIYQDLIAAHLQDSDPSALLDVDFERLEFMQEASVHEDRDELYQKAMEQIATSNPTHPAGALARVKVLHAKKEKADAYDPETSPATYKFALVELERSYREIMDKFPGTKAAGEAQGQWAEINDTTLSLKTELVNVPGKPFLALTSFRNIKRFHYRIISLDMENPIVQRTEKYWETLAASPPVRQVSVDLPDPGDKRSHSVEIGIDQLPVGRYAILSSVSPDFRAVDNPLAVQYFHVSGIAYLKQGEDHFFLDRETGKPIPGAFAQLVKYQYDRLAKAPVFSVLDSNRSDMNGHIKLVTPKDHNGVTMLDIRNGRDRLFTNSQQYAYYNYRNQEDGENIAGALFTDRAIYRPGQPLYFKAIIASRDPKGKNNRVIANRKVQVMLYDANGEELDSLWLTTSEFGSVHGSFPLPSGRLTGTYSLDIKGTSISTRFSVEEYKRPSFEVKLDPVKGEYRLNDEVKVQGSVAGYAGNMLNGTEVKYSVSRRTRLPWWIYFRGITKDAEIAYGTAVADEKGRFEISFKALPDLSVDRKSDPTFNYSIRVDATDNSGETRSGNMELNLAYRSIDLQLPFTEENTVRDTISSIAISIKNLQGEPLTANVELEIQQLQGPTRLIRERYWEVPDLAVMDREAFISKFPYDEYLKESDKRKWKVISTTKQQHQAVKDGSPVKINTLRAGTYKIIARTKDKYGEEAKSESFVTIADTKDWTRNTPSYTIAPTEPAKAEPGTKALLVFGTGADDVTMIRSITNGEGQQKPVLVTVKAGVQALELKPAETDRGGIAVTHAFVKHNRFYNISQYIDVPWSNKELQVSTETYRDKLLPGSTEKWKVKIRGAKAEKIAAELLMTMYDASLDQFQMHQWRFPGLFREVSGILWEGDANFKEGDSESLDNHNRPYPVSPEVEYDQLHWTLYGIGTVRQYSMKTEQMAMSAPPAAMVDSAAAAVDEEYVTAKKNITGAVAVVKPRPEGQPVPRKNFAETAFFIPDLKTDKDGNVEFSFTMPESLTRWKWMSFAHSKDLATGMMVKDVVTQKELMIQPNIPRFLREGDRITLTARVSNLSEKAVTGEATLQLIDPETNTPVDGLFKNAFPTKYFTTEAKQTTPVEFEVEVPAQYTKPLQYRIIARAGNFSDGEENVIPVLTNRTLVTESLPMQMIGDGKQTFSFNNLINNNSVTVTHYRLTTEYSTNPAWYAVLSLPYIMEYPYECAEQTFSRLYANVLAAHVAGSSPAIRAMFDKWRTSDTAALISNLMKNQDLKQVMIENTPWVFEAKSESQQRRNIALLFEADKLRREMAVNLDKLQTMQGDHGAFPWFKGGPDNRYITQYIITGIGRLKILKAAPDEIQKALGLIAERSFDFLDRKLVEDHHYLLRNKADLGKQQIGAIQVQYLYMRSFFGGMPEDRVAYDFYTDQAKKFWQQMDRQSQAMIAIALHRNGEKTVSTAIMKSLKENAILNPTLGMYWKENVRGYFWYQAPVETQSLLIEAFDEVMADKNAVEQMKLWLLNQKRVQSWESTKATADAVYALVRKGNNWLTAAPRATITLGSQVIRPASEEAGTGYTRSVTEGSKVKNDMGKVSIEVKGGAGLSWGAVHWQYFEDINKVKASATPLQLQKQFFVERRTNAGPLLEEIKEGQALRVGDKLKVRVVLKADRDMEFIHMKDMRASGTEPVNVLSGYRWQGGLGYYEATRDASTDFFFDWLPKGTWVFEYPLFVTHAGQFTAGICTIQSMYAPEFNAHSEGRKIGAGPRE